MPTQQTLQRMATISTLAVCSVVACTRVRPQPEPPPAQPIAARPPSRPAPVRPVARPAATTTVSRPNAAPVANPDSLNGDPKGLKREDLNNALQAALRDLAACFSGSGAPPAIGLAFDAEPDGRARNIKVTGATPEGERCVSATLARVKLPVFEGKPVPVNFPISMYRPPVPAAPAAPGAPPAPAVGAPVVPPAPLPPAPPAGSSTAPYAPPSSIPPTPGSQPTDQPKTFIQP